MKIKTANASNHQLNWLVATCECPKNHVVVVLNGTIRFFQHHEKPYKASYSSPLKYVENWSQGGPIIEQKRIALICPQTGDFWDARDTKTFSMTPTYYRGTTPLTAAMRCYVTSKLGDEVEVPEKLL